MISIIILTYNSSKFIPELLDGLIKRYEEKIKDQSLEVIVADNSSTDNTVEIVREYKNIRIVENGDNYGFAKGNNLASKKANGDFLVFLNPDSKFIKGDIFNLLKVFENEKVGIVGGEMVSWEGKKELSCGKFYNAFNTFLLALGLEEKFGVRFSPERERVVDFVSGGFLIIKKNLFEKLSGFDESYFMYIEDCDLCYRAKKLNFKTKFSPKATIQHMGQGSSDRSFAIVNIYKGLFYFNRKHMGHISYIFVKLILQTKAVILVIIGKIINNKYLADTYARALKI